MKVLTPWWATVWCGSKHAAGIFALNGLATVVCHFNISEMFVGNFFKRASSYRF